MWGSILLSAVLAGVVATAVTVAIERWGGLIGGLLGTAPSTIVPAAVGMYATGGEADTIASLSIVPFGMMLNALFLGVWMVMPSLLSNRRSALWVTTLTALLVWALLGAAVMGVMDTWLQPSLTEAEVALMGLACMVLVSVAFNLRPVEAPKGTNAVRRSVLIARGSMAAIAIGVAVWCSSLGYPLLAGLASVFPAIFLTSMVALWLAQGATVPRGAAGPMMLGGASVAVYANVAMWSLPAYGMVWGSVVAWLISVVGWSCPAFVVLKRRHDRAGLSG
ncbi:hypothetical protein N8392_00365 [Candidatus Poseidonia sp.]|nr:hypothetical protein [Poseidonia sp.]